MGAGVSRLIASPESCWDGSRAPWTAMGSHEQSLESLFFCACAVLLQRGGSPVGVLKQKKGQAFEVSDFTPTKSTKAMKNPPCQ